MHRAAFVFNRVRLTRKTRVVGAKLQKIQCLTELKSSTP